MKIGDNLNPKKLLTTQQITKLVYKPCPFDTNKRRE